MAPPVHNPDGADDRSLREMVGAIANQLENIHKDMQTHNRSIEHLMRWKTGGEKPENGIDIRMDRLERSHKGVGRMAWAAITGALGALGIWLWDQLTGKQHS
jgi:hypothetical protein